MKHFPLGVIWIIILFLMVIFLSQHKPPKQVSIGGMCINASLDEIFTLLIKPGVLDIVAILKSNRDVVWSSQQELALTDDYYNIHEYILMLATPSRLDLENLDEYQANMHVKFTRIFTRDVFIGLTDLRGELLHETHLKIFHALYIICIVFLILSVIMYVYFLRR
jgi:FtsH-binding integral membrane protein